MATEVMATDETAETTTETPDGSSINPGPATDVLIEEELLVEEVSIDGMCGVY